MEIAAARLPRISIFAVDIVFLLYAG